MRLLVESSITFPLHGTEVTTACTTPMRSLELH